MSGDRAFRRFGSSSVTSPTPRSTDVWMRASGLLVLDDGRRVLEEVLHLALVLVRRSAVTDRLLQPAGPGEALHGARRRVAVLEPGSLEAAVVDAAPVADEVEHLRRQLDAEAAERLSCQ